jgi:hypothetical protein
MKWINRRHCSLVLVVVVVVIIGISISSCRCGLADYEFQATASGR